MISDRAKQFKKQVLDSEYELSTEYIKSKKWHVRIIAGYMNPMIAEWVADAAKSTAGALIGLAFGYREDAETTSLEKSADSIMKYMFDTSHCYSIVTTELEEFVIYKDQANRFLVFSGDRNFLSRAYRCSDDAVKKMFDWWVDGDDDEDDLRRMWRKYMDNE